MKVKCIESVFGCFRIGKEYEAENGDQYYPYSVKSDRDTKFDEGWGLDSDLAIRDSRGGVYARFEGLQ